MDYSKYYCNYLNINTELLNKGSFIFESDQRNKPICFYYYHLVIVSSFNGIAVVSIAPHFDKVFSEYNIKNRELRDVELLTNMFSSELDDFNVRNMYRMGLVSDKYKQINTARVIQLKSGHKDVYFNTIASISDASIKEHKWNLRKEQIDQGRVFVIIEDEIIISQAVISDINFNGGNIHVWTSEEHSGKGYGKSVTAAAAQWCVDNGILPVYLVDKSNNPSLSIAKSVGFEVLFDEVVLSQKIK
ncbi:GNAT family N-acetyltransferase [Inconstantimicrobium mannanitabidum]|uniref:Uncharacterized protein n=1 Tax=Inconstantimicrobium mannanitabidum TaxID=1604901 RepID=A0ACB5RFU3_9CLOT|nr:GNAT family N-acetyltransferase [Clostridium sp. TW13]GKX67927.1 hypothetical protein rsdtw13_31850 [Clostridium sp. TW13]